MPPINYDRTDAHDYIRANRANVSIKLVCEGVQPSVMVLGHEFNRQQLWEILSGDGPAVTVAPVEAIPAAPSGRRRAIRTPVSEQAMAALREADLRQRAIKQLGEKRHAELEALKKQQALLATLGRTEAEIKAEMDLIAGRTQKADEVAAAHGAQVFRDQTRTELDAKIAAADATDADSILRRISGILHDALEYDGRKLGKINTLVNGYFKGKRAR